MKLLSSRSPGSLAFGILADSVNDASSTRKVYLLAAGLALLGIGLLVVTIWFWRSTRPEPALLAPLEIMGERRFRQLDGIAQHELLDSVRPEDAQPFRWGVAEGDPIDEPLIDLKAAARTELVGFDDLREPDAVEAQTAPPAGPTEAESSADKALSSSSEPASDVVAEEPASFVVESDDEPEVEPHEPEPEPEPEPEQEQEQEPEQEPRKPQPVVAAVPEPAKPPLAPALMDPLLRNRKTDHR